MSDDKRANYGQLEEIVTTNGGALFGVADYDSESNGEFPYALSVAAVLSRGVLDTIDREPTKIYSYHYRNVNFLLDQIALKLVHLIEMSGFRSYHVPASQITDWDDVSTDISHRYIAVKAGLGYIGRSNLLVSPRFGAQVRLISVLTDIPLTVNEPINDGCGNCYACLDLCPARAIGKTQANFDRNACLE